MNHPLVSILIVSFNAEAFIEKTLQSCLDQTYPHIEILLLDNCSTDQTVAKALSMQSDKITVIRSPHNVGPYDGLNLLLEKAKGTYIAIQDHDDIWLPEKIKKQVEFIETHPEYSGCGTATYYYFEELETLVLQRTSGDVGFVDHTSLLFRNQDIRYDSGNALSDVDFEKRVLSARGRLFCLPEALTVHRIRKDKGNLSSKRLKLTLGHMRDYFALYGWLNILDFMNFTMSARLPKSVLWWIRRNITLRQAEWMSLEEFQKKYKTLL